MTDDLIITDADDLQHDTLLTETDYLENIYDSLGPDGTLRAAELEIRVESGRLAIGSDGDAIVVSRAGQDRDQSGE